MWFKYVLPFIIITEWDMTVIIVNISMSDSLGVMSVQVHVL